jgi:hypothetical protein
LEQKKGSVTGTKPRTLPETEKTAGGLILEANFELMNGFVDGMNGIYAMATEIVRGMLQMFLGVM